MFVTVAMAGCAWIAQGQVNKYDRRVRSFEALTPDTDGLARGDTAPTLKMLQQFEDWSGYISQQKLPAADQAKLVARMDVARVRYLLASARVANTPDLGYALASMAVTEGDDTPLATLRELSDARVARRQREFSEKRTYSYVVRGELATRSTGTTRIAGGKVVQQTSSTTLIEKPGNCVFATRAFGTEGVANQALVFRIVGARPSIHVRCYLNRDLYTLPELDAEIHVSIPGLFQRSFSVPRGHARKFDFVIDNTDVRVPFQPGQLTLTYEYTKDLIVVWENGAQRPRKERGVFTLSESPVLWDRDGSPPQTAAR